MLIIKEVPYYVNFGQKTKDAGLNMLFSGVGLGGDKSCKAVPLEPVENGYDIGSLNTSI